MERLTFPLARRRIEVFHEETGRAVVHPWFPVERGRALLQGFSSDVVAGQEQDEDGVRSRAR